MKKFLVLYLAPASVLADWAKTDPEKRKAAEDKMRGEWNRWMSDHAGMITDTGAGGKTKRISSNGASDFKNDIMLYRSSRLKRMKPPRRLSKTIRTCKFRRRPLKSWKPGR